MTQKPARYECDSACVCLFISSFFINTLTLDSYQNCNITKVKFVESQTNSAMLIKPLPLPSWFLFFYLVS